LEEAKKLTKYLQKKDLQNIGEGHSLTVRKWTSHWLQKEVTVEEESAEKGEGQRRSNK